MEMRERILTTISLTLICLAGIIFLINNKTLTSGVYDSSDINTIHFSGLEIAKSKDNKSKYIYVIKTEQEDKWCLDKLNIKYRGKKVKNKIVNKDETSLYGNYCYIIKIDSNKQMNKLDYESKVTRGLEETRVNLDINEDFGLINYGDYELCKNKIYRDLDSNRFVNLGISDNQSVITENSDGSVSYCLIYRVVYGGILNNKKLKVFDSLSNQYVTDRFKIKYSSKDKVLHKVKVEFTLTDSTLKKYNKKYNTNYNKYEMESMLLNNLYLDITLNGHSYMLEG